VCNSFVVVVLENVLPASVSAAARRQRLIIIIIITADDIILRGIEKYNQRNTVSSEEVEKYYGSYL
jgi:hypothetical protein